MLISSPKIVNTAHCEIAWINFLRLFAANKIFEIT